MLDVYQWMATGAEQVKEATITSHFFHAGFPKELASLTENSLELKEDDLILFGHTVYEIWE